MSSQYTLEKYNVWKKTNTNDKHNAEFLYRLKTTIFKENLALGMGDMINN